MVTKFTQQSCAISAIYQATSLVNDIATTGTCSYDDFKALAEYFFGDILLDPASTQNTLKDLSCGLNACAHHLAMYKPDSSSLQINRYAASLFAIERKLSKTPIINNIANQVTHCQDYHSDFDEHSETIINQLASIYKQQISPHKPVIIVKGTQGHLSSPFNTAKIRTLLLFGFRFTITWRQIGGRRWQLLFNRFKTVKECQRLLHSLN